MKRLFVATLLAFACTLPAYADVTIKATTTGAMGNVPTTMVIKGTKMRQDVTLGGTTMSTIVDAGTKQMIVLDMQTREATIYDLSQIAREMQKVAPASDAKVSMTPTGETRQILGRSCAGYVVTVTMPLTMEGKATTVTLGGPVWVARDAPGTSDWVAFFKAAGESGLFFSGAGAGRGGQEARSQGLMYKALADAGGIPYEQQIRVDIPGAPMQPPPVTVTVTSVSTDPVPADRFEIPAEYRRVNK